MTSRKIAAFVLCACFLMMGSVFAQEPEPTPTDTPTLLPTDTPTSMDTPSPIPTDTATITPSASSTSSATNTATPFEPEITAEVTVPVAFDELPTVTPEMLDPQEIPMNLETLEPWCYFWDFTVSNGGFTPIPAGSGNWVSGQGWVGVNITLSSVNRTLAQIQKTFSSTILTRIEFDYYRMEGNINASPPGAIETLAIFINGIRRQVQFFYFASTQGTFSWTGTISNATNVYLESQPSWMSSGGVANGSTRLINATLRGLGTNPFGISNCDLPTPTPTPTDTPTQTDTPTTTPTATSPFYACRIHPNANVVIDGYATAEEAISGFTVPTPPISFSATDVLRVDKRASLYENVVHVESESNPGTWYWIDSGLGVTPEDEANCDELTFETTGMYAVRILTDGTRTWDVEGTTQYPDYGNRLFERQSIITALQQIGMAFDGVSSTAASPQDAFNRVMLENSGTEILLIRTQSTSATITIPNYTYLFGALSGQMVTLTYPNAEQGKCLTTREFTNNGIRMPASIICNGHLTDNYDGTTQRLRASQYTIVHEMGHIFDGRTSYPNLSTEDPNDVLGGLSGPTTLGTFEVRDCNEALVMYGGSFTRGRRGWGTGPQQYLNGSTTAPLITDFQQNPANTVEETAADSFLNWVYRFNDSGAAAAVNTCLLTPRPPYDHWTGDGYLNLEWSATPAAGFVANSQGLAGSEDGGLSGDGRYLDIDTRIRSLFAQYGWY